MPDDLYAVREAALAQLHQTPIARPWWRAMLGVIAIHIIVAVSVMLISTWSRHPRIGDPLWWTGAVLLTLVTIGGVLSALRPGSRQLRRGVVAAALLAVPVLSGLTTTWSGEEPFFADVDCALAEIGVSILPAAAMLFALTQFAYHPVRALVGGLAAGSTGMLVLHLACPVGDLSHWLAFHLFPYLLVAWLTVRLRARLKSQSFVP